MTSSLYKGNPRSHFFVDHDRNQRIYLFNIFLLFPRIFVWSSIRHSSWPRSSNGVRFFLAQRWRLCWHAGTRRSGLSSVGTAPSSRLNDSLLTSQIRQRGHCHNALLDWSPGAMPWPLTRRAARWFLRDPVSKYWPWPRKLVHSFDSF